MSPRLSLAEKKPVVEETDAETELVADHIKYRKKIRNGSFAHRTEPLKMTRAPKSQQERQRDREVSAHYRRLAQLDVIAELAAAGKKTVLLQRAEEVRRLEHERHRSAMAALRRTWLHTGAADKEAQP
ncbi:MAG: hypothetical protein R3C68_17260 [Myxococcota bacterium]